MALHTIKITNCEPDYAPEGLQVHLCDEVRFHSEDGKVYDVTRLDKVLRDAPKTITVPTTGYAGPYRVDGKRNKYKYTIKGPVSCCKGNRGTPDIIIVD